MDEDAALTTAAGTGTGLVPEVRAELLALAQGARETIGRAWSSHTHRAYAGTWRRFGEWASARALESLPAEPATLRPHGPLYLRRIHPFLPNVQWNRHFQQPHPNPCFSFSCVCRCSQSNPINLA